MADRRKLRRFGCQRRSTPTSTSTSLEDLPGLVIQRIQSFLPHKQALCSCLISKSWLHAWSTFPNLQFRLHHIQSATVFFKFVDKTLKRYHCENLVAEKLNLSVDCLIDLEKDDIFLLALELDYHVNQWLQTAAQIIGLKELTLSLPFKGSYEKLTLRLRSINNNNYIPKKKMVFHSLRILEVSNVHFDDQQAFYQLLSSCNFPIIEKLNILYCTGLERIKMEYFGCLVEFRLVTYQDVIMVDIVDCPRLCSFEYVILKTFRKDKWDFKIDSSSSYTNLRSLTFDSVGIDDMLFNKIVSKLPCLERLYLERICLLDTIDVSSASLIELSLIDCGSVDDIMLGDAPKLRLLTYQGDRLACLCCDDPYMKNCKPLEVKLVSNWFPRNCLKSFLKVSHKIDIEAMGLDDTNVAGHALRLTTLQYPSEKVVEGEGLMSLTITNFDLEEDIIEVLDAFFFYSRPKYVQLCSSNNKFLNFFIKKLRKRKDRHWCTVNGRKLHNKCRHHYCLREVEIGFEKKNDYWEWLPWRNCLDDDGYNNSADQTIRFRLKWPCVPYSL